METNVKKKQFNKRAFVSIAALMSGLLLPFSGYMNHTLQFGMMSTERHFWMSVHNISGIIFLILIIVHIIFNRRALLNYTKIVKSIALSKEAFAAITLVIVIVGLFSLHAFHVH